MNNLFRRDVAELGWNVHSKGTLSGSEIDWVSEFEGIPIWLANKYNEDIFSFTRASFQKWCEWIESDADLFTASLLREGILRIYSDKAQFAVPTDGRWMSNPSWQNASGQGDWDY